MTVKLQHYRVLLLSVNIQVFMESCDDSIPLVKSLDTYQTYLSLLASWPEEHNPWEQAKELILTKMQERERAYLLNEMVRVEHASPEDFLEVTQRMVEEYQRAVATLKKEVKDLEACDKDRLARIEELLKENASMYSDNAEIAEENAEKDNRIERFESKISDLQDDNDALRASLESTEQQLSEANRALSELQQKLDACNSGNNLR